VSSPWVIHPRTFSLLIPKAAWHHAAGWLTDAILLGMSRYDAEPERESNRTVVVVLLSLLILTVIGALVGYVLGTRDIDEGKSTSGDGQSARPSSVSGSPGQQCPEFIGTAAKAKDKNAALPLYQLLYVKTERRKEAWVCREADKQGLWYQGHEVKDNFFKDGETPDPANWILLSGVIPGVGNTYVVVNGSTRYTVSTENLDVKGPKPYTDPVVYSEVGG